MKKFFLSLLLFPLFGANSSFAQTIEICQVQEFLGASFNEETGKYSRQKWSGYDFDGSDRKLNHTFKLLNGVELKLAMNPDGMIAGSDAFLLAVDMKDTISGVELHDSLLIAKDSSWRQIPLNVSWFVYKRANRDKIVIFCDSLPEPRK